LGGKAVRLRGPMWAGQETATRIEGSTDSTWQGAWFTVRGWQWVFGSHKGNLLARLRVCFTAHDSCIL